jgi:hypothetical protein
MSAIGMVAASDDVFLTVVYYLFSFVVGFVSIFAPQGIGVLRSYTPNLQPPSYRAHN